MEFNENFESGNILSYYREQLVLRVLLILVPIFSLLMVFNFKSEKTVLGAVLFAALVIIFLNIAAMHFNRFVEAMRTVFVYTLFVSALTAIEGRGIYGTYWTFPVIVIISVSLTRPKAKIYGALFFLFSSVCMFVFLEPEIALRAVTGLFVTFVIVNTFLGILENLQERLVAEMVRDPLTGAFNRRQLQPVLEEAFERKHRTLSPASILLIDIDNFKSINDKYGHVVGDHVLKELVALVNGRTRRFDKLFRMGGEEFLLFLPDTSGAGALKLAENIRSLIANAPLVENNAVTVSIGLSELQFGEPTNIWIENSDRALYEAKKNGKNRISNRTDLPSVNGQAIINAPI